MNDRVHWNEKYQAEIHHARVNANLVRNAHLLKPGRVLDLAGGTGQNAAWLVHRLPNSRAVLADISDEALRRASSRLARVLCGAGALPFAPHTFDTILCIRFFDARVRFAELLTPGGTVFFETFTPADAKYRPDFNPAHHFDFQRDAHVFQGLSILSTRETDYGRRVYATVLAQR